MIWYPPGACFCFADRIAANGINEGPAWNCFTGYEGTGWSMGWKINFLARAHDGAYAHGMIRRQMKLVSGTGTHYIEDGTYFNLFDRSTSIYGIFRSPEIKRRCNSRTPPRIK